MTLMMRNCTPPTITRAVALGFLLCAFTDGTADGQLLPAVDSKGPSIQATGRAEVMVTPDRAAVYVTVGATNDYGPEAAAGNASARDRLIKALRPLGYADSSITLWGLAVGASQDRGRRMGMPPQTQQDETVVARSGFRIVVEPLNRLNEVVEAILVAGVEGIPHIAFDRTDIDGARRAAVREATQRAQLDAEAEAVGGKLGALISLGVTPDFTARFELLQRFSSPTFDQTIQLTPSDLVVRVAVQGVWEFVPENH